MNLSTTDGQEDLISAFFQRWQEEGDLDALEKLYSLVFDELRRLTKACFDNPAAASKLQPSILSQRIYLCLVGESPGSLETRANLFTFAARLMRYLSVALYRARQEQQVTSKSLQAVLRKSGDSAWPASIDLVDLNEALGVLEKLDPRQEQIVELRFFAGLSIGEAAEILSLAPQTVALEWRTARLWLARELHSG